jgi:hypothetical protein
MLWHYIRHAVAILVRVTTVPAVSYNCQGQLLAILHVQQYQLFDFGARSSPIVLILDRRDDPVTPLLTQWTYQAMIHELIGIKDNTVKLSSPKVERAQHSWVGDRWQRCD